MALSGDRLKAFEVRIVGIVLGHDLIDKFTARQHVVVGKTLFSKFAHGRSFAFILPPAMLVAKGRHKANGFMCAPAPAPSPAPASLPLAPTRSPPSRLSSPRCGHSCRGSPAT